jgi:hypothetical protein
MSDQDDDDFTNDDEQEDIDGQDEDETDNEEEQEYDSDGERPQDIPNISGGLTNFYRNLVKEARQSYFMKKAADTKPDVQKSLVQNIESEWGGVLSIPELPNATFDFQVLRNLLDSGDKSQQTNQDESILSLRKRKLEQLTAQQKGDTWRYDLEEEEFSEDDTSV